MLLPKSESYLLWCWKRLFFSLKEGAALRERAWAFWEKGKKSLWSISNQILGEVNIFSAIGFQVKEVCPPLVYKASQQLLGSSCPHWTEEAFGRDARPPIQSALLQPWGKNSASSATSSAGSSGVLGWDAAETGLPSLVPRRCALFINV